jgi:cytidyltransferase-like protein
MSGEKILPFEDAARTLEPLRLAGRRIVQCHGTFDLLHPGHIYHLEEARALGDVLVATVTGEKYVNKGPGRPYFNDQLRAKQLAALACVDYVIVVPFPAAVEAIERVRPDIYCKGREYAVPYNDVTGNIGDDVRAVERLGGQVHYIGSVVFSSSKLLNNHFDALQEPVKEFCAGLAARFTPNDLRSAVESFGALRILIVGDTIFDRYSYAHVQGLTSKNRIISGRFVREETQCGGALAAFRHVREFTPHVRFVSLIGPEPWAADTLRDAVPPEADLVIRDEQFTTVVKQRFVEPPTEGKELAKLFAVNFLDSDPPAERTRERVLATVAAELPNADAVLLLDFGHGLMAEEVRQLVEAEAPFLALNCQTNSFNHGFNIISRRYTRADAFSLDEQELLLACGRRHVDFPSELDALRRLLNAKYSWLTRGPVQTIGLDDSSGYTSCPPLEHETVDTVGAGDAFFSVAALSAARGLPIELATFMGQLAGAQAVRIVGNSAPISKSRLLKSGMALLNF